MEGNVGVRCHWHEGRADDGIGRDDGEEGAKAMPLP